MNASARRLPMDAIAERCLIHSALDAVDGDVVIEAALAAGCSAEMFAANPRRVAWALIEGMYRRGRVSQAELRNEMLTRFTEWTEDDLARFMAFPDGVDRVWRQSDVVTIVSRLLDLETRRRMIMAADSLVSELVVDGCDPEALARDLVERVRDAQVGIASNPIGYGIYDEMVDAMAAELDQPDAGDWIVPWMLRRGHRAGLVATEGSKKTSLLRWIGLCAAQGVQPFFPTSNGHQPRRVLIIDLENPRDHLVQVDRRLRSHVQRAAGEGVYDPSRVGLAVRPEGVDIIGRAGDRRWLLGLLRRHQPDLLVITPVYKLAKSAGSKMSHEERAEGIQEILDDWQAIGSGFALLLEHHAPAASGGVRDLRPMGGMRWLAWGEFGFKLLQMEHQVDRGKAVPIPGRYTLDTYRGRRIEDAVGWPDEISLGKLAGEYPFSGSWKERPGQRLPWSKSSMDDF